MMKTENFNYGYILLGVLSNIPVWTIIMFAVNRTFKARDDKEREYREENIRFSRELAQTTTSFKLLEKDIETLVKKLEILDDLLKMYNKLETRIERLERDE